jgi:hypothetical protein
MKLFTHTPTARRQWTLSAFTLVEMMFSVGIYTILFVGALIAVQIFALRVYTLAATKLVATSSSRQALNQIRDDIRQGKLLQVGISDNSGNFTPYSGTAVAQGNALEVFQTTNQGPPYSLYYLQTNSPGGVSSNNLLWVYVTTNSTTTANLCTYITNLDIFAAESWDNWPTNTMTVTPITNSIVNNQIYSVKFDFYQWEYPIAVISTNSAPNAYDYYQLRTRVCRRALN